MASLAAEGSLQAALGGVVLFAPESAATPLAITAAFAVLVLPYSLIGPFAAAALDRWDRRSVIAAAGGVRTLVVAAISGLALAGAFSSSLGLTLVFCLTLAAMGLGRLINTGMTAALPHVVPLALIPVANSFLVTFGSLATALGAVVALIAVGIGDAATTVVVLTLLGSMLLSLLAAVLIVALPPHSLGPSARRRQSPGQHWIGDAYRTFAGGLAAGVRAARKESLVWASLAGIGLSRAAFGVTTLAIVLLFRDVPGPMIVGVGGFTLVMGMFAFGMGIAAIIVPWALPRMSGFTINATGAAVASAAQITAATLYSPVALIWTAALLGMGSQMIKLVGDYAMQTDVADDHRGGVFALQDTIFNTAFVAGMAVVAWWIPINVVPTWLLMSVALAYSFAVLVNLRAQREI